MVAIVSVMSEIDFFISSTCNFNIITWVHMKMLMIDAIDENIGHFDNEIDCAGSEGLEGMRVVNIMLLIVPASGLQQERRLLLADEARRESGEISPFCSRCDA